VKIVSVLAAAPAGLRYGALKKYDTLYFGTVSAANGGEPALVENFSFMPVWHTLQFRMVEEKSKRF